MLLKTGEANLWCVHELVEDGRDFVMKRAYVVLGGWLEECNEGVEAEIDGN